MAKFISYYILKSKYEDYLKGFTTDGKNYAIWTYVPEYAMRFTTEDKALEMQNELNGYVASIEFVKEKV